ncbi:MAG: phosphoribosylglycinamide formyltransferase [Gammaproteobacteria bacterium]|nr:MAG: phosphoribosylglycinamide formyltransferase [Gammaproteobacteria bacterium]
MSLPEVEHPAPQRNAPLRMVVLISGSGSNLQALIDAQTKGLINTHIVAVISNRPDVKGLQRADHASIENHCLNHRDFEDRQSFDQALHQKIQHYQPDLVVLAGFMRILTAEFTRQYVGKMINIHPSLLPKYQGLNTHQRAIDDGQSQHGCSIHFVTEELDGGPVIAQAQVPVLKEDDAQALAQRVQQQEHWLFPQCVKWFGERRIALKTGKIYLDEEILPKSGKQFSGMTSLS